MSVNGHPTLPEMSTEDLERWLEEARGLDTPPAAEAWGLGVLDSVTNAINNAIDNAVVFRKRQSLESWKQIYESSRTPGAPLFRFEEDVEEELRSLPMASDDEDQIHRSHERDHLLLGYLRTLDEFLEENQGLEYTTSITRRLTKIVTRDFLVFDLQKIMTGVRRSAEKHLDHCLLNSRSAGPGPKVPKSRWGRSSKIIPITNRTARDISWVLTTTTHKVDFEAGIDGIKAGADGVDVGLILKAATADGEDVPTQMGCVQANSENEIPVTHRGFHYITIYDQKGLHRHCENMPTKAGRSIVVYRDVFVEVRKNVSRIEEDEDDEEENRTENDQHPDDDEGNKDGNVHEQQEVGKGDKDAQEGGSSVKTSWVCLTSLFRYIPWGLVALAVAIVLFATVRLE